MEVLTVIALLCQMSVSRNSSFTKTSDETQLSCQKYYLQCVAKPLAQVSAEDIANCLKKRVAE